MRRGKSFHEALPSPISKTLTFMRKPKEIPTPQSPPLLCPLPPILGTQFCVPRILELTVTIRSIRSQNGDKTTMDFDDGNGKLIFAVGAATRGPKYQVKRVLRDAMGTPLACAQMKLLSMRSQWDAHRGNQCEKENRLFKVRKSSYFSHKTSLDVLLVGSLKPPRRQEPDVRVMGDYLKKSCILIRQGKPIAQINPTTIANPKKTIFILTVHPNIDTVFIALLAVIMEELHLEKA